MRTTIAFLVTVLSLSALAQGPIQREPVKLWVLDGLGEVQTLEEEIVVDLPGGVTMEMVLIPAGSFMMGSTDDIDWASCHPYSLCEQPVHEVNIGYDFYMGKTEVAQAQWLAAMGSNPSNFSGDSNPVENVSWNDCQNFITALNQLGQGTFRLPSEAEWEYACRAGTTTRFYFGDSTCFPYLCEACDLDNYAWWCENSDDTTHPVGQKLPNAFGLHGMHGNVYEWCEDDFRVSYVDAPSDGSPWVDSPRGSSRIVRGGSWADSARNCRSSYRYSLNPDHGERIYGFRLVRDVD